MPRRSSASYVDCVSPTTCVALGTALGPNQEPGPSLLFFSAGKVTKTVPAPLATFWTGLTCASATLCIGVGNNGVGSAAHGLVDIWDGSLSEHVITAASGFEGVSCSSPTYCVATGGTYTGTSTTPQHGLYLRVTAAGVGRCTW